MGLHIGGLYVRRSVFIDAPSSEVWKEFASFERIAGWLGIGQTVHKMECKVGGNARLSIETSDGKRFFGGPVLVYDEGKELSFASQWDAPTEWTVPTFWTIRLSDLYGGTHVELFHHGFERLGASAADQLQGYEEGWGTAHLRALRESVLS